MLLAGNLTRMGRRYPDFEIKFVSDAIGGVYNDLYIYNVDRENKILYLSGRKE